MLPRHTEEGVRERAADIRSAEMRLDPSAPIAKYTMPDGSTKVAELKTGEALLRPPVTHADEALDDVEAILVEIKQ